MGVVEGDTYLGIPRAPWPPPEPSERERLAWELYVSVWAPALEDGLMDERAADSFTGADAFLAERDRQRAAAVKP